MFFATAISAAQASTYYQNDNYYTRDQNEAASEWFGEGARLQGLEGEVTAKEFQEVLEGELPDGTVVGMLSNREHRAGVDLTFSAPKSVSIMALVAGDDRVTRAHMGAVKETLAWTEKNLAEARIRHGDNVEVVKTGNLMVALFAHDTSRSLDPQLHVHAVMANITQTADGRWRAQHNDKFFANNTLIGSIYHSFLREKVEALGYQTELTGKHGTFEIKGFSREAIEMFSGRRQDILEKAAELGIESPQGLLAVSLRTRDAKKSIDDREGLYATWEAMAVSAGLDLKRDVAKATARSFEGHRSGWEDISSSPARATMLKYVAAAKTYINDLVGKENDNPYYVRPGLLPSPASLEAAKSVASAVHHLSERDTSFHKYEIAAAALHLGLQTNIHAIEKQIGRMVKKNVLLPGQAEDKFTTQHARDVELQILSEGEKGRGKGTVIVADPDVAGKRLQEFAVADKGYSLNIGQETAGRQILASEDRFLNVQGVAGSGKSSMLRPSANILQQEGKNVLILGVQNILVQNLAKEIGVDAVNVAKFLATHKKLLDPNVNQQRLDFAKSQFKDSVLIIDEASMLSNEQSLQLKRLANILEIDRMVDVGDKRQLGAVEAGKPFELSQRGNVETNVMDVNLRSRSADLRLAAQQANSGAISAAFRTLKEKTISVGDKVGEIASERWLRLSTADRDSTLLMTSGRVLMKEVNERVQEGLLAEGTIGGDPTKILILDKVQATNAELQSPATYEAGMRIDIQMDLRKSQGFAFAPKAGKFQSGTILSVDREKETVRFRLDDGKEHTLLPRKLPINKDKNPVRLSKPREINIYEGDKLRWTDNDANRHFFNGTQTKILGINANGVEVTNHLGVPITLPLNDPMLSRVDLAYALNTHQLQGATSDNVISAARASETNLSNARNFLVNITRARDGIEIIVDDANRYGDRISKNPGDKSSALETTGETPGPSRDALIAANAADKAAGNLPGQLLAAAQAVGRLMKPAERQPDIADRGGAARTRDFER